MACAITMNYAEEAIGIAQAARRAGLPAAISFTVETDGRLPTGQTLAEAIDQVDAATSGAPTYYMINCAHPTHFQDALDDGGAWVQRIRGVRANASHMSHAELNESAELDVGDPAELGAQYAALKRRLESLNVMGGCCGTDARHIEQIALARRQRTRAAAAGRRRPRGREGLAIMSRTHGQVSCRQERTALAQNASLNFASQRRLHHCAAASIVPM
jgi:S-methylmethionine-dependent homocysteine/selenocysteine methylase